jgi:hypothetical protein
MFLFYDKNCISKYYKNICYSNKMMYICIVEQRKVNVKRKNNAKSQSNPIS